MKKAYLKPSIEIISARVERGYTGSFCSLNCGSERMTDNGRISFGTSEPYDNGSNMEGIGDAGTIYF